MLKTNEDISEKPPHGDRAATILLKWISFIKFSKYGQSEYSRALNASYTFQPLVNFWILIYSSSKSRNLNLLPIIQTSVKFRDFVSNIFSLFRRIIIKNLVSCMYLILTQYPHTNSPNRYPYSSFKN